MDKTVFLVLVPLAKHSYLLRFYITGNNCGRNN